MPIEPVICGTANAARLERCEGGLGIGAGHPAFDLNEGKAPTPSRNEINLTVRRPMTPGQNAIALREQQGGGYKLGGQASPKARATFGRGGPPLVAAGHDERSLINKPMS